MLKRFIKTKIFIASLSVLTACGTVAPKKSDSENTDLSAESKPFEVAEKYRISASVEQQFEYGLEAMQIENYIQAIELFKTVADKEPRASGPWVNMAIAYRKLDRINDADKAAQKAVELNPKNPYALNQAGLIKRELGQFEEAESHYRNALSEYPNYSNAHLNLAILCDLYLHKIVCAKSHYQAYQEIEKSNDKKILAWMSDLSRRESQIK